MRGAWAVIQHDRAGLRVVTDAGAMGFGIGHARTVVQRRGDAMAAEYVHLGTRYVADKGTELDLRRLRPTGRNRAFLPRAASYVPKIL